jgi:hypothetical protein
MRFFGIRGFLGFSLALASTASYSATKTCDSLLQASGVASKQLYMLPGGALVEQEKSLRHQSSFSLAYIVPSHAYSSGVVILKVRHHVISTAPPPAANPKISMFRTAYRTPCAEKANAEMPEFSYSPDVAQYRSYHYYRLPDAQMDRVHADLGNRPKGWWGDSDNRCVSTSSWDIRPQLLFEDNISDRQVIAAGEYFGNRVSTAFRSTNVNESAVAAPVAYSDYRDLVVRIIPYRKAPDRLSCVNISVGSVPSGANWTDVMIIDADDARYPRDPFADPQKSWRFQWN